MRQSKKFNVLHAQTSKAQSIAVLTKIFHQTPIVYSRRVNFAIQGGLSRFKYSFTDRVIAISEAIQQSLNTAGITPVQTITSIVEPLTVDSTAATRFIADNGWQHKKIIATVAALTFEKDPHTLVNSIAQLKSLRQDFILLHFGDGNLNAAVAEHITRLGLNDCYQLLGHRDDVEQFFPLMDVFVLTSIQEGLGSSLLDAFMQQVPVVATRAGGIIETVADHGLLCEIGDSDCLANAMHRLLDDAALRVQFTTQALAIAQQKHSSAAVTQAYLAVFRQLA